MYTIKRFSIFVSIFWFSMSLLNAQTPTGRYGFSLTPLSGILFGQSEEIVYKYAAMDHYLSQLLWDLKPLVYLGFAADFGPRDPFQRSGFVTSGSVKFGLPLKSGIIEDRDWLYSYNQNLTNYSMHDAYSQNAILADISAGYSWRLRDYLALSLYGEFSYMHFSWMAEDGYLQYLTYGDTLPYPPENWTSSLPKEHLYGPGIRYSQNWFIFSPVISLRGKINRLFSLEGNFSYSPLIYCMDRDDHLARELIFWDYLSFGHYINGGGKFIFSPNKTLDLFLSLSYRYITGSRGQTYQENTDPIDIDKNPVGEVYHISNNAGVGYSVLDIELAAKIRIGN